MNFHMKRDTTTSRRISEYSSPRDYRGVDSRRVAVILDGHSDREPSTGIKVEPLRWFGRGDAYPGAMSRATVLPLLIGNPEEQNCSHRENAVENNVPIPTNPETIER